MIMKKDILKKAKDVKFLILDVDGVMTDGSIILDGQGNEYKRFHVRDGHGIKMLNFVGIKTAIITGRRSKVVEVRAKELGIEDLYQKIYKKSEVYKELLSKYGLEDKHVAFMGDDTVDIEIFKMAGLTAAPADAEEDIKGVADFISSRNGGRGAVREFAELILKATGNRDKVSGEYID